MATITETESFLDGADRTALVEVARAKGSTPRESRRLDAGLASAIYGTIGGGQLEYMAIDKARQMLTPCRRGKGSPLSEISLRSTSRSGPRSANAAAGASRC